MTLKFWKLFKNEVPKNNTIIYTCDYAYRNKINKCLFVEANALKKSKCHLIHYFRNLEDKETYSGGYATFDRWWWCSESEFFENKHHIDKMIQDAKDEQAKLAPFKNAFFRAGGTIDM